MSIVNGHARSTPGHLTDALQLSPKFTRLGSFESRDLVVLCNYLIELKLFCLLKIFASK